MPRSTVVTIHGVGDAQPGDTIGALASSLGGPGQAYARSDLFIGGTTYPRLLNVDGSLPDLVEVNWSDIQRPPRSALGAVRHLIKLGLALPGVTFDWLGSRPPARVSGAIYRRLIEASFLWITLPVLLTLAHSTLTAQARLTAVVFEGGLLFLGLLTLILVWRWSPLLRWSSVAWLAILSLLVTLLWTAPSLIGALSAWSVRLYGLAQIAAVVLLYGILIEVNAAVLRRRCTWRAGLAALALAYLPLAILSVVGSCLWALALNALQAAGRDVTPGPAYADWQRMFLDNLGYDLAAVEWSMAVATALVAVLMAAGAVRCLFARQGRLVHRGLGALLGIMPLAFSVPALLLFLTSPYFGGTWSTGWSRDVMQIYKWSALRVGPWLLLLATPVAIVLDVLGDVALYLVPDREPLLSARAICRQRLDTLLRFVSAGASRHVHVVAHSQGAVVAYDVLGEWNGPERIILTTMGSPLGTLYRPYLDWPPGGRPAAVVDWRNLYREGDYIGGPIGIDGVDEGLGPGGHTGYWTEARLRGRILEIAGAK